ncbi:glycosyl hydrolase [Tritrichomonas foetus]|uniref:alpha-mannosidase n=1 Tax=Tritrichomonas foetus TaxID=1144522 RepID=A0A1J4J7D4_9EUKA|nr:glycosyl hydrolase [Tritrichomonas foetus]|eukprot:OHS95134.1 glycosyl hydrolase [Tritrichomonas foetus]
MLFFFIIQIFSSFSVDPQNTVDKITKINGLINLMRQPDFLPASHARFGMIKNLTGNIADVSFQELNANDKFKFGKRFYETIQFNGTLEAPSKYSPEIHSLLFEFSITPKFYERPWDDEFPAGPEGMIFINDKPFGAIDEFHKSATIEEQDLGNVSVVIFTGRINSSHTLNKFGVSLVHKETEILYQRIRFLLSVIKLIPTESIEYHKIVTILDETVRILDIRDLSYPIPLKEDRKFDKMNSAFYESVGPALLHLRESMNKLPKHTDNDPAISVIGYSHIDTCWEWPFALSHNKIANTAVSMLRLIEQDTTYGEFNDNKKAKWKFLATSAQHYKWLKEDNPEIFDRMMKAIKNGRWEANGASWVESDITILSGESLVRQLVLGSRYFENELKLPKQTVFFVPDCFGFSASLPQILRGAEIDSFITSKISWSEYTTFPYSTFKWRGIDGSEVFTHFVTTPTYWKPLQSTYTGTSTAYEIIGTYKNYKQRHILPTSALHTSGNGDGGGGITEEMVWNLNLMNELPHIPEVPRVQFPTLTELFEEIKKKENELPIWDDELYLEYHRGTLTSQEEIKRLNRKLETLLHNCEWLSTICYSVLNIKNETWNKIINDCWEDTLLFQFHDALPGTSINEANADIIMKGLQKIQNIEEIQDQILNILSYHINFNEHIPKTLVFNTLSHRRLFLGKNISSGGWSTIDCGYDNITFRNSTTTIAIDPPGSTKYNFEIQHKNLSPIQNQTILEKETKRKIIINPITKKVETPYLDIILTENGSIHSVKDKSAGKEFLSSTGNLFELYEDRPVNWPAWDIQLYHKEMILEPPVFEKYEFHETSIDAYYNISRSGKGDGNATTTRIKQTLIFSEESPHIKFLTTVNWTQHNKLLKVVFPTTIRNRFSRFGIQFGSIQRPTHMNTMRDMAKFETSGRWADLSDSDFGVTLYADVKMGYDVHDNIMRLSLLKSPLQTDKWCDFGTREFTYCAYFHATPFEESKVQLTADEFYNQFLLSKLNRNKNIENQPKPQKILEENVDFVTLSTDKIIIETMKLAFDKNGFVVRLYESIGGWRKGNITFHLLQSSAWNVELANLLEKPILNQNKAHIVKNVEKLTINIELQPFEIMSLLITKKNQVNEENEYL